MLSIELVREIPEAMKPRKIEIGGTAQPKHDQIEATASSKRRLSGPKPVLRRSTGPGEQGASGAFFRVDQLAKADAASATRSAPRGEISSTIATNNGWVMPEPR